MILKVEENHSNGYTWWDGIRKLNHCEKKIDPREEGQSRGDIRYSHIMGKDPGKLPDPLPEDYKGTRYIIIEADFDNGERHDFYIESGREVYLLNNEGKTIERL